MKSSSNWYVAYKHFVTWRINLIHYMLNKFEIEFKEFFFFIFLYRNILAVQQFYIVLLFLDPGVWLQLLFEGLELHSLFHDPKTQNYFFTSPAPLLPCRNHVNWFSMQFSWFSCFIPIWKNFLDGPKMHKHNILKKPFETKTN